MRTLFRPAVLVANIILSIAPALAAPQVCINTRDIVSSTPQDRGAAILFKMRDGTQWRNTLQSKCPDLEFEGYAWTVQNPDGTVCDDMQSLRVLRSGEVCLLGKFEKVAAAH